MTKEKERSARGFKVLAKKTDKTSQADATKGAERPIAPDQKDQDQIDQNAVAMVIFQGIYNVNNVYGVKDNRQSQNRTVKEKSVVFDASLFLCIRISLTSICHIYRPFAGLFVKYEYNTV